MTLFDPAVTADEAASRLVAWATGRDVPSEVGEALGVLLEERQQCRGVLTLIGEVRKAQRRYFADRTQEALIASKELERRLDSMLKE